MPINTTQQVSREIKSLLFVNDGSLNVVLVRFEDGSLAGEEAYRIEPEQATALLDVPTIQGMTIRQQIVLSVYAYLIESGVVKGTIQG